jgi:5-(carboxyamino)imidazole ribonucleotide synthase
MKVGVLGAGQLGRMLALAGMPLGVDFVFYDQNPDACAAGLGTFICADFNDTEQLQAFANQVDVVTLEFENIPLSTLETIAQFKALHPAAAAVQVAQDRLNEKTLFTELGIPTPAYYVVDSADTLSDAASQQGEALIVKSRRFGYDGKGQATLENATAAGQVWDTLGGVPLIAEQRMAFDREVSMIAVRNPSGDMRFYPLAENVHQQGILVRSRAIVNDPLQANAEDYAQRVMQHLDYVGVLAFEFFDCGGELVANEIAPRVHNSGHWSIEGAVTSQFENHIRAILDWPLGDTTTRVDAVMFNLIGNMLDHQEVLKIHGAHLHDYGKAPRQGRKLGHITLCNPTPERTSQIEACIDLLI